MSPVLAKRSNGQDVIIAQQKSGMAYAFDPDNGGALRVAVPHQPGQRPRRTVGRGGRRQAGVLRRRGRRRPAACEP